MADNLTKIQVDDSLGNLVDAVNTLIHTLRESEERVGDLEELRTINSDTIVNAVNSLVTRLDNTIGNVPYFETKSAEYRFKELTAGIGDITQYDYLEGTNLLEILDEVLVLIADATGNSPTLGENIQRIERLIEDRSLEKIVSAEQFGIVSSSSQDQTELVVELFNHAAANGAAVVYFPPGVFQFRSITVEQENLTIRGSGRRTTLQHANNVAAPLFRVNGSITTKRINATIGRGEVDLPLPENDLNFASEGDWVRVEGGQRLSRLPDSDEFTTGDETGDNVKAYYHGQFNRVQAVSGAAGTLTIRGGIQSSTVLTNSQRQSSISRMGFHRGLTIEDLSFKATGRGYLLNATSTHNLRVDNVTIDVAETATEATAQVLIDQSLRATVNNTRVYFDTPLTGMAGVSITSSESCTINGSEFDSAAVAVYIGSTVGQFIGSKNRVTRSTFLNITQHAISEEATHDTTVSDCTFSNFITDAIRTTGRRLKVSSSEFTSSRMMTAADESRTRTTGEVGVRVWGRGAQGSLITNNTFRQLDYAIRETGPLEQPKDYSGLVVSMNSFTGCARGYYAERQTTEGFPGADGVNNNWFGCTIIGNTFTQTDRSGESIVFGYYVNGFNITGNTFYGNNEARWCLYLAGLCNYITVTGNMASGFNETSVVRITDRSNDRLLRLVMSDNSAAFRIWQYADHIYNSYSREIRSIWPQADSVFHLGGTNFKWHSVWLANSPNVSSDRRLKRDIVTETLGLNFINALKPYEYKKDLPDENERTHHGFVAQEVEAALKKYNCTGTAIVTKSDDSYSMSYEQLIAPMAKAIQELSAKVDELEKKQ